MNKDKRNGWMNLQLFAEGEGPDAGGNAGAGSAEGEHSGAGQQTFTLEEVTKLIQSETDKRVTQALNKQKKDYEKKLSLSGLDEQQRTIAEKDQAISDLQEKLKEMTISQNRLELAKTLAGRNLPTQFADFIDVGEDMTEAQARIDALDKAFKQAVDDAVSKRLAGQQPPGRGAAGATMTKEQIMKIRDAAERQAAIRNNIELFQKG